MRIVTRIYLSERVTCRRSAIASPRHASIAIVTAARSIARFSALARRIVWFPAEGASSYPPRARRRALEAGLLPGSAGQRPFSQQRRDLLRRRHAGRQTDPHAVHVVADHADVRSVGAGVLARRWQNVGNELDHGIPTGALTLPTGDVRDFDFWVGASNGRQSAPEEALGRERGLGSVSGNGPRRKSHWETNWTAELSRAKS